MVEEFEVVGEMGVNPLRLVFVTRRFWPLVGGAERAMANLAAQMAADGDQVTILTARWDAKWPEEIAYRGVQVVRLDQPDVRYWGSWQYLKKLARWLRQNEASVDLVYVSMLKHDAYAALGAMLGRVPVVLRAEGAGRSGDCLWQLEANCGSRIKARCLKAEALIGPSRAIERELIAAGYPRPRIHHLPNGVPIPPVASTTAKAEARTALAAANRKLSVPYDTPLILYTGRLHEAKGLGELIDAFGPLRERFPTARLWMAGEGSFRGELQARIDARGLSNWAVVAGVFDDVSELLAAADLFVLPSHEEGMSLALLEAMAARLPVVATDIPGNREVITDSVHGRLVPVGNPAALRDAMAALLDDPAAARRIGDVARTHVENHFSLARSAMIHRELFGHFLQPQEDRR